MAKPCSARTPAAVDSFCRSRARNTYANGASVPPGRLPSAAGLIVSGDLDRLPELSKIESAAARDGLPCVPLLEAHSLAHLPRLSEGANLAEARQTKTARPRTGHRPCPASAAQLMRPNDGQG